jgi:hypothetical protein
MLQSWPQQGAARPATTAASMAAGPAPQVDGRPRLPLIVNDFIANAVKYDADCCEMHCR